MCITSKHVRQPTWSVSARVQSGDRNDHRSLDWGNLVKNCKLTVAELKEKKIKRTQSIHRGGNCNKQLPFLRAKDKREEVKIIKMGKPEKGVAGAGGEGAQGGWWGLGNGKVNPEAASEVNRHSRLKKEGSGRCWEEASKKKRLPLLL